MGTCVRHRIVTREGAGAKTFRFNGIKLSNSLPTNIKDVDNKVSFKIKCKSFLADKMINKEDNVYVM